MENFLGGFLVPLLLLTASMLEWSLISLVDLLAFLLIQLLTPRIGFHIRRRSLLLWCIVIFSVFTVIVKGVFHVIWHVKGEEWSIRNAWWAKLIGFVSVQPWRSKYVIYYFLVIQLAAALVSIVDIYARRFGLVPWQDSCWGKFSSSIERLGSHLRVACCLLLPAIQLAVGISHPSWISLPFFICSCVGLVDWSLTSNFLGLFRWWRPLLSYAGVSIVLLYSYQLPVKFPMMVQVVADFVGFCKLSAASEWPEICSGVSLLVFYFMMTSVKYDLEEMDALMSMTTGTLTEQLLPSKHSFFIRESRSGVRHTNVLLRGAVFRHFSINFFTYGFPVLLLALSFWSFNFASICAFGLLLYVGYILYAFPSLFHLRRFNGLLLVFILLWAASTYVFNVAFTFLNKKMWKDMEIWETVGLWHYPIPGFFLLAQFCLGVLIAMGNLVNNSVFLYFSDEDGQSGNNNSPVEEKEDTKVLIVATMAWGLRKCSRAITLALIFLLATKSGLIHAVYMVFFLVYLLCHRVSKTMRQVLILLCEAHFAILYILQLDLVSRTLEGKGSLTMEILSQLGLGGRSCHWDFIKLGVLMCFCAVQNHGSKLLFSLSSIVQNTAYPPFGFSILKAGLNKSVLLSVYTSPKARDRSFSSSSHDKWISTYLSAMGQKFLSLYRSCGTYIAFATILFTVYLVTPNYVSFGYLFFLLLWIMGRQLGEKTRRHLWFPLKAYAVFVLIFLYSLSIFPSFKVWLSKLIDLYHDLGYNPKSSLLENIWESLAVLIVMQLYSYERRQSKYIIKIGGSDLLEFSHLGFARRFLIWHSEKILSLAVFYASISPISAFGFLYLLGLVICSTLPKTSHVPSKLFLLYTGFLVNAEYLFQMWGELAQMFPGQKHSGLAHFLGFQVFRSGFWGLESGLRGKVLVVIACTLQYNVFYWLKIMPSCLVHTGKWEEPCNLFIPTEHSSSDISFWTEEKTPLLDSSLLSMRQRGVTANSCPSFGSHTIERADPVSSGDGESGQRRYSFGYIWGSSKESHKWNKKRIISLKRERFDTQKTMLKLYMKFWIENVFNLLGLEINMIELLVASFAVLNAISMLYVLCLVACILLERRLLRKLWPLFVITFASILTLEYLAIWNHLNTWSQHASTEMKFLCHDCLSNSYSSLNFCKKCWLGVVVDDPRMLVSYYVVFMFATFKLRCDRLPSYRESSTYRQMMHQRRNSSVWRDLSFETKSLWTVLDYLRLYLYTHLLDIVLVLILITGTLEYDILHLGYLGFALVFFRMRLKMLKKKNRIFKFLRMYNFAVIVLSLAYQSPFLGGFAAEKCEKIDYIYKVIGFYKYDYGFSITSRSALVEIIIFVLVSIQSYIFNSREFDYVSTYIEAEQIGAIVHEQEKKAAWKTAQLQHIRKSEEQKRLRNLQVEKMKSEMLNLQIQLHSMNSGTTCVNTSPERVGIRRRRSPSSNMNKEDCALRKENQTNSTESLFVPDFMVPDSQKLGLSPVASETPNSQLHGEPDSPSTAESVMYSMDSHLCEITEVDERDESAFLNTWQREKQKRLRKDNPLISAVQLIGDGVSQVQSLGNQAVSNIVSFLNIENEEGKSIGCSLSEDGLYDEIESQNSTGYERFDHMASTRSFTDRTGSETASLQLGKIFRYIWGQIRSNNDVVCYCCFILVFLWNFSLLSMVYLAALFLYALCVNTGPSSMFWVIVLIYTEVNILLQYLYQIIIQHCGLSIHLKLLEKLGFPAHKITSAFFISTLPLFLVYVSALVQSSITAKDGEWESIAEFKLFKRNLYQEEVNESSSLWDRARLLLLPLTNVLKAIARSFSTYWKSLTFGAESPPYFLQLSLEVGKWPEDGIQPERIESGVNQLLIKVHEERCKENIPGPCHSSSRVRVQSIERSQENSNVALAVFEVVYASPLEGCPASEWYKSLTPAADVAAEIRNALRLGFINEIGFPYPILSVIGGGKREVDLYAYTFGADLAVFFLVAIFYQSVIKNNDKFLEVYQLEDQFPKEFVFILMVVFFLIVLDRIIYLCSFATGKVIFYLCNLVLFTYSVTEYAWYMKPSHLSSGGFALRSIYLTKALSLALQALQIRYGLPHKSTLYRQFLTSKVSQINYLGFRLYRALPFLYELRCVLDWSCTATSLTMYDWLKLEDIHASLYLVKCDADLNRGTHKQGEKQTKMTKFCSGICLFFILICVIWAPMLMYSSGNPTNIANPIKDASVQIDIKAAGGRLTLYQSTLCEIFPLEKLHIDIDLDPNDYLDTYNMKDIQLICCQSDASVVWLVPQMVQSRFIKTLDSNMKIIFLWVFNRDRPKGKEVVKYEIFVPDNNQPMPFKVEEVFNVFNGSANTFRVKNLYPRYFRVTGSGDVRYLEQAVEMITGELVLNRGNPPWWSFHDINKTDLAGCGGLSGPTAIIVSEETPQGILGETLSKFSIWGIYISFVLAVGRFIRIQCSDLRMRIPYENLPSCDRLIAICEDIYAARAEGELEVEEVLYWTLVKIYRSPHMLLEYTKPD